MTTIRAYTDIEQSKKLAEILPIESADMCYIQDLLAGCKYGEYKPYIGNLIPAYGQDKIRCWSLASLLGVLPLVDFTTPQLIGTPKTLYRCIYNDDLKSHAYDNPVDACVDMVMRLNELNLL